MPTYTVAQGECISSIADKTGFFWDTIWNHPNNANLKELRQNPNALLAGDELFIPDKRKKEESCEPTRRHVFRILGIPVKFNLRVLDADGNPRAGIPYTLSIDGKKKQGTIPNDGQLSQIIAPDAKKAVLTLTPPDCPQEVYNFDLGYMNPSDNLAGVQARLTNLGYYKGAINGNLDDATSAAIRAFQLDHGLDPSGQSSSQTENLLAQLHGG